MTTYNLAFTLLAGPRAITSDVPIDATSDVEAVGTAVRTARKAAVLAGVPLGEVHVDQGGTPFFNWAKDYSFTPEQAADFYAQAMTAR